MPLRRAPSTAAATANPARHHMSTRSERAPERKTPTIAPDVAPSSVTTANRWFTVPSPTWRRPAATEPAMTLTSPSGAALEILMPPNVRSGTRMMAPPKPPMAPSVLVTIASATISRSRAISTRASLRKRTAATAHADSVWCAGRHPPLFLNPTYLLNNLVASLACRSAFPSPTP